jgi:uncharacterized repeat protein (TIGR03987 family)
VNPILVAGTIIVNLALISYGIGIFSEQRNRRVSAFALRFLWIGVVLDIVATACMITGSSRGAFTLHGLLGFSSLTAMVVETALATRHRKRFGDDLVPGWLHGYSRFAYGWWLVAYVTGAYLVMSTRLAA